MRLLLTRPEPDAERTAAALRARGHEVVVLPLMRIEPVADVDLGCEPWGAVVVTSANACRAIAAHPEVARLRPLRLFAVGARTAQAAEQAGFSNIVSAAGGLSELISVLLEQIADRSLPLLYLAGTDRSGDLAGVMATRGFTVRTLVVYRAVAETTLPPAVQARLAAGEIDGVLHFSARSAHAFLAAAAAADLLSRSLKIQHYCLSAQVASPLVAAAAAAIHIAPAPNEQALVDLAGG